MMLTNKCGFYSHHNRNVSPNASRSACGGRVFGLALFIALTACQTQPVRDRVVTVSVPIATTPLKPEQIPKLPAPLPKRPASVPSALDLALSKWCEGVAYMLRADPLLRVSAGLPPLEPPKFPECER